MFDIYHTFDLSYLGNEWKDCYLRFHTITVADIQVLTGLEEASPKESTDKALEILENKFIEGFAVSNKVRVAVKKEELKQFPINILLEVIRSFTSGLDKKKENPSGTSSEVTQ